MGNDNRNVNMPTPKKSRFPLSPPVKITAIYLLIGIIWILFSDSITSMLFQQRSDLTLVQNLKGVFYVITTGIILFYLIRKYHMRELKFQESLQKHIKDNELLLKEVHHRVKNNLQIISSLLALQAEALPNTETRMYLEISKNRIKSMAIMHEHFYRDQHYGAININNYLKDLVSHYQSYIVGDLISFQLKLPEEEIYMSFDTAVTYALLVNEIIGIGVIYRTTALTYSDKQHTFFITFYREKHHIIFSVHNSDSAESPDKFRNSTPMEYEIAETLVKQLGASMEHSETNGFRIKLSKPAPQ